MEEKGIKNSDIQLWITHYSNQTVIPVQKNAIIEANDILLVEISPSVRNNEINVVEEEYRYIELVDPWNQLICIQWLPKTAGTSFKVEFPSNLISGQYVLHYQNGNSRHYWYFYHHGRYKETKWYIAYAITIDRNPNIEVQIAIPRQQYPYLLLESFQSPAQHQIITDGISNWLLVDLATFPESQQRVVLGYRAWIAQNYFLFDPESLLDQNTINNDQNTIIYLKSEVGIEANDNFLLRFGEAIEASTVLGLVYQITWLIHSHLKYILQKGEFGAKYAVLNRQGDCTEYAALFVALCRQNGLPARLVAGFKREPQIKGSWIEHAWAEFYYNGLWVPIDILEGFIIGNLPDLIPLFRGNWLADSSKQEFQVRIKKGSPKIQFENLNVEFKHDVFSINDPRIPQKSTQLPQRTIGSIQILKSNESNDDTHTNLKVIKNSLFEIELTIKVPNGKYILIIYTQNINGQTLDNVLEPKIILTITSVEILVDFKPLIITKLINIRPTASKKILIGAFLENSVLPEQFCWEQEIFDLEIQDF